MSKGVDIPINSLVETMTNKLWTSNTTDYNGRVYDNEKKYKRQLLGINPEIFESGIEYKEKLLSDKLDATIFFRVIDTDYEERISQVQIYFSVNLSKLYPTITTERADEYAVNEATNLIKWSEFRIQDIVRGKPAFDDYFGADQNSDDMQPYYLFRIDTEVSYAYNSCPANGQDTFNLILSSSEGGSTVPTEGTYSFNSGENTAVYAAPDTGYRFLRWLVNTVEILTNPLSLKMNQIKNTVAEFIAQWQVNTSVIGNGTITPSSGQYDEGAEVTFEALPNDEETQFDKFTRNGVDLLTNPYSEVATENVNMVAYFSAIYNFIQDVFGTPPTNQVFDDQTEYGNNVTYKNVQILTLPTADYADTSLVMVEGDVIECYGKFNGASSNKLNGANDTDKRTYWGVLSGKWAAGIGNLASVSAVTADTNYHLFEYDTNLKEYRIDGVVMGDLSSAVFASNGYSMQVGKTNNSSFTTDMDIVYYKHLDSEGNLKAYYICQDGDFESLIDISGNGKDAPITTASLPANRVKRLDGIADYNIESGYTLFQQIANTDKYTHATYDINGLPTKTELTGYTLIQEIPKNFISRTLPTLYDGIQVDEINTDATYHDIDLLSEPIVEVTKDNYAISNFKLNKDGDESLPYVLTINKGLSNFGILGNEQGILDTEGYGAFQGFWFNGDFNTRTLLIDWSLTGVNNITFRDTATDDIIGTLRCDFNSSDLDIYPIYINAGGLNSPVIVGYCKLIPSEIKRLSTGIYYAAFNNSLYRFNKFINSTTLPSSIVCLLGDSLTALGSGYSNFINLPRVVKASHGSGGEITTQIAGRYELMPFELESELTIPTTTTAVVVQTKSSWNDESVTPYNTAGMDSGSIGGIEGTFEINGSDELEFTRNEVGSETIVPINTEVKTYSGQNYLDNQVVVLWMGINGGFTGYDDLLEQYKACAAKITSGKYIFISSHTNTSDQLEADMLAEFGDKYLNMRNWCVTTGLSDCGITPTQDDIDAIALGNCPPSLLVDIVHFIEAAREYQGVTLIPSKINELNYI